MHCREVTRGEGAIGVREFLQQVVPRSRGSSGLASSRGKSSEKDCERFSNYRLPNRRGDSRENMRTSNWIKDK